MPARFYMKNRAQFISAAGFFMFLSFKCYAVHPAVACKAILDTAFSSKRAIGTSILRISESNPFRIPYSVDQAPNPDQIREIETDLRRSNHDAINLVVSFTGADQLDALISSIQTNAATHQKHTWAEINERHFKTMMIPFYPLYIWSRQIRGLHVRPKELALFGGWRGIVAGLLGLGFVLIDNPVANADRFVYLLVQDDRKILDELRLCAQPVCAQDSYVHISRNYNATSIHNRSLEGTVVPDFEPTQQVLRDTRPFLSLIAGAIVFPILGRSDKSQRSAVYHADLFYNKATQQGTLLIRIRASDSSAQ